MNERGNQQRGSSGALINLSRGWYDIYYIKSRTAWRPVLSRASTRTPRFVAATRFEHAASDVPHDETAFPGSPSLVCCTYCFPRVLPDVFFSICGMSRRPVKPPSTSVTFTAAHERTNGRTHAHKLTTVSNSLLREFLCDSYYY